ncbi:MAG: HAD family hydrolase, partial [Acholeplasmatales bacterium]|nr:HAD family hydrolase [Acholeplasmatales bacterium]
MEKLIFDLDGTLWDTKDSYLYAYDKLVKEFNISPRLPDEKILEYMGIRLDLLLDGLFKGLDNLEEIGKRAVYYSIEYVINHP